MHVKIDIICPLYNAEDYIINLDKSLKKQKKVSINSIIYVLTESKDNTEKILKENNIKYKKIKKSELSHSLTREKEAMNSKADIICFVTQDVVIESDLWLYYLTKNIIVQKINTKMASDNYYWDLETIGSGNGYYITNGYAIPITWQKTSREAKTKYTYLDGTEVLLNDGNTYVQLQSNKQKLTIE